MKSLADQLVGLETQMHMKNETQVYFFWMDCCGMPRSDFYVSDLLVYRSLCRLRIFSVFHNIEFEWFELIWCNVTTSRCILNS